MFGFFIISCNLCPVWWKNVISEIWQDCRQPQNGNTFKKFDPVRSKWNRAGRFCPDFRCILLPRFVSGGDLADLAMAEDTETTLQRSQSTPEPIFDPTSSKEPFISGKKTVSSSQHWLFLTVQTTSQAFRCLRFGSQVQRPSQLSTSSWLIV